MKNKSSFSTTSQELFLKRKPRKRKMRILNIIKKIGLLIISIPIAPFIEEFFWWRRNGKGVNK